MTSKKREFHKTVLFFMDDLEDTVLNFVKDMSEYDVNVDKVNVILRDGKVEEITMELKYEKQ